MSTTYGTDANGFKLRRCPRCQGSGLYSKDRTGDSTCYTCKGRCTVHTVAAAKAFRAWIEANRAAGSVAVETLAVGDAFLDSSNRPQIVTEAAQADALNAGRVNLTAGPARHGYYAGAIVPTPGRHVSPDAYASGDYLN